MPHRTATSLSERSAFRWLIAAAVLTAVFGLGLLGWRLSTVAAKNNLGPELVSRYDDPSGETSIEQVSDPYWSDRYQPFVAGEPVAPARQVWYRVLLENPSPSRREVVLEVRNRRLAQADLYSPTQLPGTFVRQMSGTLLPPAGRAVQGVEIAFPVELEPRSSSYVFLRVRGAGAAAAPIGGLRLWEGRAAFERVQRSHSSWIGFYLGLLTAALAYHAVVFFALKLRENAAYVMHIAAFGAYAMAAAGVNQLWLPDLPQGHFAASQAPLLSAALLFAVRFAIRLFETRLATPWVHRLLVGLTWAWGALAVIGAVDALLGSPGARVLALVQAWALAATAAALLLAMAALLRRRGGQVAVFLLSFSYFLFALTGLAFASLEEPAPSAWEFQVQFASAAQMVLGAFAVGRRLQQVRATKEMLQARYTRELESEVRARTVELTEASERLRLSNEQKDRLFSIIAHDLRGPLNAVIGMAGQMARQPVSFSAAEIAQASQGIHDSGLQLRETLENLLQWARLQTGRLGGPPAAVELAPLVDEVARLYAAGMRQKAVRWEASVPAGLCAMADYETARTILRNLVSNAVKFTPQAGAVRVTAQREEATVAITVTDEGPGMDAAQLAGLFQLRSGGRPRTEEHGAGIGLVLCADLASHSGGRISAESTSGAGAAFTLRLPAA